VCYSRSTITEANDATSATIVTAPLKEAQPLTKELAETTRQLARFEKKQTAQRTTVVAGATDRETLIALLRRNANLIKEMRVQLKPYQSSPTKHKVWERFQSYTRLIILGGGGPKGDTAAK
jgi:wyosine [tRNA(Phe)-imidazoG37] synthetase (radical SAM superfamily)